MAGHTILENVLRDLQTTWFLESSASDGGRARRVPINANPFRVGRRSDLELSLPSRGVSKVHAEIVVTDDVLFLRDLQSTNGTYVNGRRISADTPIGDRDLVQFGDIEFRVKRAAAPAADQTLECASFESVMVLAEFEKLLEGESLTPWFQPVIRLEDESHIGYESLARSTIPGLETPGAMFSTAARLEMERELSIACRSAGMRWAAALPASAEIFLNTHPREQLLTTLLESLHELRSAYPDRPLTLEIHEGSVVDPLAMQEFRSALNDLGIKLAYDDFGAGQSRLLELAQVPPDYLKFDMGLVRNIHKSAAQQQMVATLVRLVQEFGIAALAEGVETADEAEVCREIGFDLAQGFYYGKPAPVERYAADLELDTEMG